MIEPKKIADAPRHDIAYAGVALPSRYGQRHELEAVMGAVHWILDRAPDAAALIDLLRQQGVCRLNGQVLPRGWPLFS